MHVKLLILFLSPKKQLLQNHSLDSLESMCWMSLSLSLSYRSQSSRSSSVGLDCGPLSPVELHCSNADDVFPEATDCHAAQCPIHQRYGGLT